MANGPVKQMHSRHVDTTFYRYDPRFGFWGIPDIEMDVSFRLRPDVYIRCRHNEEGNRDKPCTAARMKSPIICLGGSHTWGVGIEQEDRYTDYLEQMTGRPVLNLGHCSLGLDQICLVILETAERYKPSAVVVEQYPWAIHRVLNTYVNGYTRPYFQLDARGDLKLRKMPALARYKACRRLIGAYYSYLKELREFQAGINLKEGYDPWADPIFLAWKTPYYDYHVPPRRKDHRGHAGFLPAAGHSPALRPGRHHAAVRRQKPFRPHRLRPAEKPSPVRFGKKSRGLRGHDGGHDERTPGR